MQVVHNSSPRYVRFVTMNMHAKDHHHQNYYNIPWAPNRSSGAWNHPQHVSEGSVSIGLRRMGMRSTADTSTPGSTSTHAVRVNSAHKITIAKTTRD